MALCAAIAHAEGFWTRGARPRHNNNPGDLIADGSVNERYLLHADGWLWLAAKVERILNGGSTEYPTSLTWQELANRWTGGDHAGSWCDAVTDDLNLDPSTRIVDWLSAVDAPAPAPAADPQEPAS